MRFSLVDLQLLGQYSWNVHLITYSVVVDGSPPGYYTNQILQNPVSGFGSGTMVTDVEAPTPLQLDAFAASLVSWEVTCPAILGPADS